MAEVFKPDFAVKSGVRRWEGVIHPEGRYFRRNGYYANWVVGKEVFLTSAEARAVAEVKRVARIASLERQIAKLKAMSHAS